MDGHFQSDGPVNQKLSTGDYRRTNARLAWPRFNTDLRFFVFYGRLLVVRTNEESIRGCALRKDEG